MPYSLSLRATHQRVAPAVVMLPSLLVAAQLSALFTPYQSSSIVLPTSQADAPLPATTNSADPSPEHASFSHFFSSPQDKIYLKGCFMDTGIRVPNFYSNSAGLTGSEPFRGGG